MKFGVIVFPGSNCDLDAYYLVKDLLGQPVSYIWHEQTSLAGYDALILPGGFSYGDYLRSGAIARFAPVMAAVEEFARQGGLVLGICNGFQVLVEAGLLPGALYRNSHLQFRCEQTYIRVENNELPYTAAARPGQILQVPVAHGDGNYYAGPELLREIKNNRQVVFRYVDENERAVDTVNPNGSVENIAGVCDTSGRILGMMPHPERAGEALLGSDDGLLIFRSMLEYFASPGGAGR